MSNDAANRNLSRIVVIPVTSHSDRLYPGEAAITLNGERRKAVGDQIMAVDKSKTEQPTGYAFQDGHAEHRIRDKTAFGAIASIRP